MDITWCLTAFANPLILSYMISRWTYKQAPPEASLLPPMDKLNGCCVTRREPGNCNLLINLSIDSAMEVLHNISFYQCKGKNMMSPGDLKICGAE